MANSNDTRLPLKVVITSDKDHRRPETGGGPKKVFGEVTKKTRERLKSSMLHVQDFFSPTFEQDPNVPAVARVILKEDALAKSHRPSALLNENTCPVIGVRAFGELLITVQPDRVRHLVEKIEEDDSKAVIANLSAIERIEPYTEADALGEGGVNRLRKRAKDESPLKFKLFKHGRPALDDALLRAFAKLIAGIDPKDVDELDYGHGMIVYRLKGVPPNKVEDLARFVGTQSLSEFPTYRVVRTASLPVRAVAANEFPPPEAAVEYPVVGIVDSGIAAGAPLDPWIVARHEYVPSSDRDHDHGSFIGGLVTYARKVNQDDGRFPSVASKIVDVVAIPKSGAITEDELLAVLDEVVPKHPEVRVWNLSLATASACTDNGFSDLATKLDDLQDRYNTTFVLAAGNYAVSPFRGWPAENLGEADRICAPADSLRGVTVASRAHIHRPNSRVKNEEPSPFSRRGPGPVFVPKPELCHYGGNCDAKGQYAQTGVLSFDGKGNIAENIGTSFASPLIATLLANVDGALAPGAASRTLAKALLVHSAILRSSEVKAEELRYHGFGVPGDLGTILNCEPWSATLVFEPDLLSGYEFEKRAFPIPPSLRTADGRAKGEFIVTLVYDPPLDPNFGAEYCRSNVDVSLGTYGPGKDGKLHHKQQIPPEPQDVNLLYEKNLVEHGFKWSPVKVYRRHIARGISGDEWRLKVTVHHRAEFSTLAPQRIALLVTMRDPEHVAPVYNEVVAAMVQAGWATTDLAVKTQVRIAP